MTYGDPEVDALIPLLREYFVANYFDGEVSGLITTPGETLADEVAEIFAVWVALLLDEVDNINERETKRGL